MSDITALLNLLQYSADTLEKHAAALDAICDNYFPELPPSTAEEWFAENYASVCTILKALSASIGYFSADLHAIHETLDNEFSH